MKIPHNRANSRQKPDSPFGWAYTYMPYKQNDVHGTVRIDTKNISKSIFRAIGSMKAQKPTPSTFEAIQRHLDSAMIRNTRRVSEATKPIAA